MWLTYLWGSTALSLLSAPNGPCLIPGMLCYAESLSSIKLGLEPDKNPRCLVLGPNEVQALDVSLQNLQQ